MALDYPSYPGAPASAARPLVDYRGKVMRRTVAAAATVNAQARQIKQVIAGEGEPIPEVYGTARVAARLPTPVVYNGALYLLCVWCGGPVQSIARVFRGDQEIPAGDRHDYTGTPSQTADSWLVAAISGYADDLEGICYSVIRFTSSDAINSRLIAEIQGRNDIYDPRGPSTGYSDNPALCLAHAIDTYSPSTLDWSTVEDCADACDELVTGAKRRTIGLSLEVPTSINQVVELLREYAGCFVQWCEPVKLAPNRPRATDHTLTAANIRGIEISKRGMDQLPNRVTVRYTDTSATEWRRAEATVSDIAAGAETRPQILDMPGFQSHAMATRQAAERLNYYRLCDLDVVIDAFDDALAVAVGDVLDVTHPLGLANKTLRVLDPVALEPGRWRLMAEEYSADMYSDDVSSKPGFTDTNLPTPATPADPSGLALTEVNYRLQNGSYASRIRIQWTDSAGPYLTAHRVLVTNAGAVVFSADLNGGVVDTGPLQELVTYWVSITAVGPFGESAAITASLAIVGKYAIPSGPTLLNGSEVGGEVRLWWPADTSDYDIQRYEVRYGLTSDAWDDMTVIDRTDSLTLATRNIPPGDWRFALKSIDSVGQESSGYATKDITVTLDDKAFQVGAHDATTASTTYLHETVEERGGPTVYYSDGNDTWNSLFASAMSTYTGALLSYQSAQGTSEWLGDEWDVTGADNTGDWLAELDVQDLSGTASQQLGIKPDAGSYTYGNLSQKATGRYGRARVQSTGIFRLEMSPRISLNSILREERGEDTSSAAGAKTITLSGTYQAARSIQVTPRFAGSVSAVIPIVDNVVVGAGTNSFDVHIFDAASPATRVAKGFTWTFEGV